jgi:hypothetical protein
MLSVASLTKRLVQMGVRSSSGPMAAVVLGTQAPTYLKEQTRSFAVGSRKKLDAKNTKRLKIQAKKKKNLGKPVRFTGRHSVSMERMPHPRGRSDYMLSHLIAYISLLLYLGCGRYF